MYVHTHIALFFFKFALQGQALVKNGQGARGQEGSRRVKRGQGESSRVKLGQVKSEGVERGQEGSRMIQYG